MSNEDIVHRRVLKIAAQRLLDEPVVLFQGPRTSGKTYILNELAKVCGAEVLDLDDLPTLDAVRSDVGTFIGGPSPVLVDEYQHERTVLAAIKAELNKDLRPGRFVLAGSTRSTSIPEVAEYLTGRVSRIPVLPFSQGEIDGTHERFAEVLLFGNPQTLVTSARSTTTRLEYAHRIVRGGMPLAVSRVNATARNRWYDEYVPMVIARTVSDVMSIRQPERLSAFLNKLASQTGQVLNITNVAESVMIDRHTAVDYLGVLEDVFLVRQLPAWGSTLTSRTTKAPKIHMLDSGLAARLLRMAPDHLARRDASALAEFGHLLETFVVGELIKQATWLDALVQWSHWRTRDGIEVDFVLERDDGCIVGVEIKAGTRVLGRDLTGLEKLRQIAGDAFLAGVVLYTGDRSYSPSDKIYVIPLDRVWSEIE